MAGKAKAIRDLPNVNAPNFLQRVKEVLQVAMDDESDNRVITINDLVEAGIAEKGTVSVLPSPTGTTTSKTLLTALNQGTYAPVYEPDLTAPPTPTGLSATAGTTTLFIQHDAPAFTVGHGYLRTLVYGAKYSGTGPLPTYTEGVTPLLTEFQGEVGSYGIEPNEQWHIWAKWKSVDGELSAVAGGTNGVSTASSKFNGGLHIAVLTVGDALIADLTASKLTAGSLQAGSYIRSSNYVAGSAGFNIPATGAAEFSGVTVRGTVNATAGTIGTAVIGTDFMRSTNYAAGSSGWKMEAGGVIYAHGGVNGGAYTGYAWPAAGAGNIGFHLSSSGLLLGNANNGKYFQVEAGGNVYAPQLSIVNGAATYSGTLNVVSSGSGDRMEITNGVIRVYSGGVLRVKLGNLA